MAASKQLIDSISTLGSEKVAHSVNMVLYWLGIITLGLAVVTIYDKYLTSDTFGLPSNDGFWRTSVLIVPLLTFFLLTMLKHGALSLRLTRLFRRSRLASFDLRNRFSKLTAWMGGQGTPRMWEEWLDWKLARLLEGDIRPLRSLLVTLQFEDGDELEWTRERFHEIELEASRNLEALLVDLEFRATMFDEDHWAKSIAGQLIVLRTQIGLHLAIDLLLLEIEMPGPSLPLFAMLLWKIPVLRGNQKNESIADIDENRLLVFLRDHADTAKLDPDKLLNSFEACTFKLMRQQKETWSKKSDEELQDLFDRGVLQGLFAGEEWDVIENLNARDVFEAYSPLSPSRLIEEAADDSETD